MNVRELRVLLSQFDDDIDVSLFATDGYIDDIRVVVGRYVGQDPTGQQRIVPFGSKSGKPMVLISPVVPAQLKESAS